MIGVAITTLNRREKALAAVAHWKALMPPGSRLVIVDDGSDEPFPDIDGATTIRHRQRMGVAYAKNTSIAALDGIEHLFLADDDVWPIRDDWWEPYVNSPEPHLSYQWTTPGRRNTPYDEAHRDSQHWSIKFPRGVLLYLHRSVIDTAGGMDIAYGGGLGEHVEYANRIHAAGLTRWPYADVVGSDQLWHAEDKAGNTSTFPAGERRHVATSSGKILNKVRPTFIPYREGSGLQDFSLGPKLTDTFEGVLDHVLTVCKPSGSALEFGVGSGGSLRRIAKQMPALGFDSFDGLPEDWEVGRFEKGAFACDRPRVNNAKIIAGLFDDTVPGYKWPEDVSLIHLDADLYSSTMTVLDQLWDSGVLRSGVYIVFDEYHGAQRCVDHEQRAWAEFAERTGVEWSVIGHGPEQWAIRII